MNVFHTSSSTVNDRRSPMIPPTQTCKQQFAPLSDELLVIVDDHAGDASVEIESGPTVSTERRGQDHRREDSGGCKRQQSDEFEQGPEQKRLRMQPKDGNNTKSANISEVLVGRVDVDVNETLNDHEIRISKHETQSLTEITYPELNEAFIDMIADDAAKGRVEEWIKNKFWEESPQYADFKSSILTTPKASTCDSWPREILSKVMRVFFAKEIDNSQRMVKRKENGHPETRGKVPKASPQVSYERERRSLSNCSIYSFLG